MFNTNHRPLQKQKTNEKTNPPQQHTHTQSTNEKKPTQHGLNLPFPLGCTFLPPPSRKKNKSLTALLRPPTNVRCAAKPPPLRALPVPPRSACQPARAREPAPPTSPLPSAPAALRMRRSHGSILLNRALSLCAPHCPFKEKGRAGSLGGGRCCPL